MEDPEVVVSGIRVSDGTEDPERSDDAPDAEQVVRDLATLGEIEEELGALDVALRRLDDDTYWTCEACGEAIDEALLADAPLRRRCAVCVPAGADGPGAGT